MAKSMIGRLVMEARFSDALIRVNIGSWKIVSSTLFKVFQ